MFILTWTKINRKSNLSKIFRIFYWIVATIFQINKKWNTYFLFIRFKKNVFKTIGAECKSTYYWRFSVCIYLIYRKKNPKLKNEAPILLSNKAQNLSNIFFFHIKTRNHLKCRDTLSGLILLLHLHLINNNNFLMKYN